jgi:hypothetical protein
MRALSTHNQRKIQHMIDRIVFAKRFSMDETIVISGSPRTGTTWLMEILAGSLPSYLSLYEPLHLRWFSRAEAAGFTPRTFIDPADAGSRIMRSYLEDVFTGKTISLRPHYRFTLGDIYNRLLAKKLLVKFVRANRLLPHISRNYALKGVLCIHRHPCATIASQIRTRWHGYMISGDTPPSKKLVLREAVNIPVIDNETRARLQRAEHMEEILAIVWALDFLVPERYDDGSWHTVKYEDLVLNGRETLADLYNYLGETDRLEKGLEIIDRPSITTRDKSDITDVNYQLAKWEMDLTQQQIERIRNVLEWFNITFDRVEYEVIG